jgi:hypothetical protein
MRNAVKPSGVDLSIENDRYSHISEEEKRVGGAIRGTDGALRKSSTPERAQKRHQQYEYSAGTTGKRHTARRIISNRRKQLINLFEKNNVADMIDQNAILFHSSNDMLGNLFDEKED